MSFQDHIALAQVSTGEYSLTIHDKYWIVAGPNGGYLAALFANAGNLHLNSPERQLRSLTTHFLSPPKLGEATITVKTERSGRLVDFLRLELVQNNRTLLLATGVWGSAGESPPEPQLKIPKVPSPDKCTPIDKIIEHPIRLREQWETRSAMGEELTRQAIGQQRQEAELSWWIRPVEPTLTGTPLIVAISDALPPPIFAMAPQIQFVPTVDLTVHIRAEINTLDWPAAEWVLVRFATRHISHGYLEEDGQIWLRDGTLLGMSRQLSVAK